MPKRYLICILILLFSKVAGSQEHWLPASERICGFWESKQHNLIVQIYMENRDFRAKIVWFRDTDGKPMSYWRDVRNPDPRLRHRRILGMSILNGLQYHPATNSWEDGEVYDSTHGRTWNASAYINKKGLLKVRGYWHFKFIGRTMTFFRVRRR